MTSKTIIYTDGGSVSYRGNYYGGWGFSGKSETSSFFGYGACKSQNATNNFAELDAYVKAGRYVLDKKITDVVFKLDSKYVLSGANKYLPLWEKNNWLTRAGQPVKNKQMWLSVKKLRQDLDASNVKHSYEWVKGHSGEEGNELADKGATKGIALSKIDSFKPVYGYDDAELIAAVKKVKVNVPKMLCLKRLLVVTNTDIQYRKESEHFVYYQTNFDDKQNVRSKYCGRKGADVIESVLFTKNKIDALELIKKALSKNVGKEVHIPGVIQLDKALSKDNLSQLSVKKEDAVSVQGDDVVLDGATLLAYPIKVALMSLCAYNSMNYKYTLLECYLKGQLRKEYILNITDMLLETDENGSMKVNKETVKEVSFKVNVKLKHGTARLALMPNVNFPQMVKLNGLAKEGKVKVSAVLHNVSDATFQYSFIVESDNGDVSIFDSPDSNLRLLSK